MEIFRSDNPGAHGVGHPWGYDAELDALTIGGPGQYHSDVNGMGSDTIGRVGPNHFVSYEWEGSQKYVDQIREALKEEHNRNPFREVPGAMCWEDPPPGVDIDDNWLDESDSEWKFSA